MRILVINSGSSSLKFSIYETTPAVPASDPSSLLEGELSGVGSSQTRLKLQRSGEPTIDQPEAHAASPADAARLVLDRIAQPGMPSVDAIGYRVVHPGPHLAGHQRITPEVLDQLEQAVSFAPLHDPAVLAVIRAAMKRFPRLGHFACFDTEFHRTMPPEASTYTIPKIYRDQGVRRYGFHGLSCESVLHQLQQHSNPVPQRMVIAHLGSGCSVTALHNGRSVDTSMGLTPDGGVTMGTRPGDLDPGLVLYLLRQQTGSTGEIINTVEAFLNHNSGMVALSGLENNMQTTRQASLSTDQPGAADARLALQVFTRSITKAIGSYAFLLGGLETIVFTGGIGEHDVASRAEILGNLSSFNINLDLTRNSAKSDGIRTVSASESATTVLVVPAQEDLMIAIHVANMANPTH